MAPSHVDLSTLWVPIMPSTDGLNEAMEKVGQDATESFGKGSDKLGDKIHESVTKSQGKIKDVFHRTGSDAGKSMSDAFKEETKAVEDTADSVGKKAGGRFRGAIKDALPDSFGAEIGGMLTGGIGGALEKIDGYAKNVGIDISGWTGPAREVVEPFLGVKDSAKGIEGSIKDWSGNFEAMPGKIGRIAEGLSGVAGEIGIAVAALKVAEPTITKLDDAINNSGKLGEILEKFDPARWGKDLGDMLGADKTRKWLGDHLGYDPDMFVSPDTPLGQDNPKSWGDLDADGRGLGSLTSTPDSLFSSGPGMASVPNSLTTPGKGWGNLTSDDDIDLNAAIPSAPPATSSPTSSTPSSFVGGTSSSYSSPSDLHAGGSRVANLYAVARSLEGTPYSQALRNDCSGMVSKLATAALGMPPSVQFSTVNEGDWLMSHGFKPGVGPAGSLQVGWYDHGGGNNGHTAATLPNGMNAESGGSHGNFLVGSGAAGANDPQFTQHAWLPMDRADRGGQKPPLGSEHDPFYVTASDKGGSGSSSGGSPLAQQFGSSLLGGVAQSVGLDGSVFHTFNGKSNPMDFGLAKLGTGLLNSFGGMLGGHGAPSLPLGAMDASHASILGLQPNPRGASASPPTGEMVPGGKGGGGGGPGDMAGEVMNLAGDLLSDVFNPGPGAPDSKNYFAVAPMPGLGTPGGVQANTPRGESVTHNHYGNVDQSFNVTNHGVKGNGQDEYKAAMNSSGRTAALSAGLPG